jgi:hypothetical protein
MDRILKKKDPWVDAELNFLSCKTNQEPDRTKPWTLLFFGVKTFWQIVEFCFKINFKLELVEMENGCWIARIL